MGVQNRQIFGVFYTPKSMRVSILLPGVGPLAHLER